MLSKYCQFMTFSQKYLSDFAFLLLRLIVARDFFKAGLLKIEDYEGTVDMFYDDWYIPLINPNISAFLATFGEIVFPILLVIGAFTRIGAIGLFIMALVIEVFIYPNTTQHYYWFAMLLVLWARGGGNWSLDHLIIDKWLQKKNR